MAKHGWMMVAATAAMTLTAACDKAPSAPPAGPAPVAPGTPAALPGTPAAPPSPAAAGTVPPATAVAPTAAGPESCKKWAEAVCAKAGPASEGCKSATSASSILPASACAVAMGEVDATVTKLGSLRKACDELVDKICKDLGPDTKTCGMVKQRTPSFPAERCTEMMGNYEQVIGELRTMEKANQPLAPELAAKQAGGDGPAFGPKDAKVTVVEYSDFQCPYCATAATTVKKLKAHYATSPVRFVFRHYPLPFHKEAGPAAQASLAAHAEGKFWEFHDLLFANQRALDRASLEKYAADLGLDTAKFKEALDKSTYEAAVQADVKLGEEVGVSGTPTVMIDRDRIQNAGDYDALVADIDKKLTAAGVDLPKGE